MSNCTDTTSLEEPGHFTAIYSSLISGGWGTRARMVNRTSVGSRAMNSLMTRQASGRSVVAGTWCRAARAPPCGRPVRTKYCRRCRARSDQVRHELVVETAAVCHRHRPPSLGEEAVLRPALVLVAALDASRLLQCRRLRRRHLPPLHFLQ